MSKHTAMNGDVPKSHSASAYPEGQTRSQTIDHVKSYPLIADLSKEVQKTSLGAKATSTFQYLFANFAEPIFPYLQTPFSIIRPYLQRADSMGDSSLNHVDEKFPAVKTTDLEKVRSTTSGAFYYPFHVAGQGRDYLVSTYNDEYQKVSGAGVVGHGKAIISTELRVAADAYQLLVDYLGPKKDEARVQYEKAKKVGKEKAERAQKVAEEKKNQVVNSN